MAIKFTKHALHVIKRPKIEKTEINTALDSPNKMTQDKFGIFIAQKII